MNVDWLSRRYCYYSGEALLQRGLDINPEYLTTCQESNLMVMKVLEEEGIRLAVPVRRVLVEDSLPERYEGILEKG